MAYLRLLVSRGDDAAIERVINTPPRGIGSKTLETLRDTARTAPVHAVAGDGPVRRAQAAAGAGPGALEGFRVLVDELDTATDPLTLEELVDRWCSARG
jgi:DNA helicase-2/ATP-dependent DNA helicase PcrA